MNLNITSICSLIRKPSRSIKFFIFLCAILVVKALNFYFEALEPLHNSVSSKSFLRDNQKDNQKEVGPTAVIHVGPFNCGSSLIQASITSMRKTLQLDGYETTGGFNAKDLFACYIKDMDAECDTALKRKARQIGARQSSIILSADELSSKLINIAENKPVLDRFLLPWPKRKFLVVYKRFFQYAVDSHEYQMQQIHPSKRDTFADTYNEMKFDWIEYTEIGWTNDTVSKYSEYFGNASIEVINMHDKSAPLLEKIYCNALDDAKKACKKVKNDKITKPEKGIPLVYDELVQVAIANKHYKQKDNSWKFRGEIVEAVRRHQEEELGLTPFDFPRKDCLSETRQAKLLSISLEMEKHFFPDFFASEDGENALRSEFSDLQKKGVFCNIDYDQLFESDDSPDVDIGWLAFFKFQTSKNEEGTK